MTIFEKMKNDIKRLNGRSAWDKGVNAYALELIDELAERAKHEGRAPKNTAECKEWALNGSADWNDYSWGGSDLIYDSDIVERLCTPSELRKTRNGERRPNSREEWLDVQAREAALHGQICREGLSFMRAVSSFLLPHLDAEPCDEVVH